MPRPLSRVIRNWFGWLMGVVLVASLAVWFWTRDTLPRVIRIGAAVQGGLYYDEGARVAEALRRRVNRDVQVVETAGSRENVERLLSGELDAAIVQGGSVSLLDLAIVTPLHRDVVIVVTPKPAEGDPTGRLTSLHNLAGRRVLIGLEGSGMHESALAVLGHYNLTERVTLVEQHFMQLLTAEDNAGAAAIVTTGVENGDLRRLLSTGRFDLLPLDAHALAKRHRHFSVYEVPSQMWPPVPDYPVTTVSASALLVVREDAPTKLVSALLDSIFEDNLPEQFSTLFSSDQARQMTPARLHPVTRRYHDPFGRYGVLHSLLEGLAAGKELLFALGAAVYLAWDRWRRVRERESNRAMADQKNLLDSYLERTLQVERRQREIHDPHQLQKFLDEVTDIKLQALDRLTHEDLRGDRAFSIFLMQCANLISKIQLKIINATRR